MTEGTNKRSAWNLLDFLKTFGISSTTNFDLYAIAKFLEMDLEIYMKNEIGKELSGNIIFNYQTTNQNGTHWVAYSNGYYEGDHKGYYFDSFGLKPLEEIEKHVKVYNKIQVQHFNTEICGILCIYFLYKIHLCKELYGVQRSAFDTIISEMLSLYNLIRK